MAPLGWSGGSQFSSTVLPVGVPVMVSMRGGEGARKSIACMCGNGTEGTTGDSAMNRLNYIYSC